ncbi:MAG: cyclic nucleotide-binding domain-containing protein [Leptospiraceae bacterium]|nr:cyclic nucleotide-binding domain-containing protein [Leptospiraceae bacterium]MCB1317980.1 cyclic nucleotide-binding domain-containing protein [Leptospiraceae bacterium]MCB1318709.1 cyclic nucleotide-binding domain-containing protein [Leptospiraceae bacterium]
MKIVEKGTTVSYTAGDIIYRPDFLVQDPGAFLILDGEVEVTRKYTPLQKEVFVHGPGELFGVLEIYTGGTRQTEARARGDVRVIAFTRAQLERNMVADLNFGILAIRVLSKMLRQLNSKIKTLS